MDRDYYIMIGKWFGYPECCSKSYGVHHNALTYKCEDRTSYDFPLAGTGFVPCPACAERYTAEELTAQINKNRICPIAFPYGVVRDNDAVRKIRETLNALPQAIEEALDL